MRIFLKARRKTHRNASFVEEGTIGKMVRHGLTCSYHRLTLWLVMPETQGSLFN
ncbi:hypothetical protein [Cellulophaga baltica]|uniref:hypothetical protein n=1 Tax=Cellulophaga baltica TaxID=76594 RepID=UPI0015866332|nr:hypothetical protein [Cellulophaga baltica]